MPIYTNKLKIYNDNQINKKLKIKNLKSNQRMKSTIKLIQQRVFNNKWKIINKIYNKKLKNHQKNKHNNMNKN